MEKCRLVIPGTEHADEAAGFVSEFRRTNELYVPGSNGLVARLSSYNEAVNRANYQAWWPELAKEARLPLTDETIPNETYFLTRELNVGERIVGVVNVKTVLDAEPWRGGGIVLLSIRPSERGNGYASVALLFSLLVVYLRGMRVIPVAYPDGSVLQGLFERLGARWAKEETIEGQLMREYVLDVYSAMNLLWQKYREFAIELPKAYS